MGHGNCCSECQYGLSGGPRNKGLCDTFVTGAFFFNFVIVNAISVVDLKCVKRDLLSYVNVCLQLVKRAYRRNPIE